MECRGSAANRTEDGIKSGNMRLMRVECEICDEAGTVVSDHGGVYICARCHRDIVSPYIHD